MSTQEIQLRDIVRITGEPTEYTVEQIRGASDAIQDDDLIWIQRGRDATNRRWVRRSELTLVRKYRLPGSDEAGFYPGSSIM